MNSQPDISRTVKDGNTLSVGKPSRFPSFVRMAGRGSDILAFEKPSSEGNIVWNHIKKSGLACTIRSDNGFKGIRKDLKVDMIDGDMTTESMVRFFVSMSGVESYHPENPSTESLPTSPAYRQAGLSKGRRIVSPLGRMKKKLTPL